MNTESDQDGAHYPVNLSVVGIAGQFFVPDQFKYYSPSYSWLANQFGHVMLGLLFSVVCFFILFSLIGMSLWLAWLTSIFVLFIAYFFKELNDFSRMARRDNAIDAKLKLSRKEIVVDCVADGYFVCSGILLGASLSAFFVANEGGSYLLFIFIGFGLAGIGFYFFGLHYLTHMILWKQSGLPKLLELAHCRPALVNPLAEHLAAQSTADIKSQCYVGRFDDVTDVFSGIARRRMASADKRFRRVRYWHCHSLLEALGEPDAQNNLDCWALAEAEVNIVWAGNVELPTIEDQCLELLRSKIWLVGSGNTELPKGWQQLVNEIPIKIVC